MAWAASNINHASRLKHVLDQFRMPPLNRLPRLERIIRDRLPRLPSRLLGLPQPLQLVQCPCISSRGPRSQSRSTGVMHGVREMDGDAVLGTDLDLCRGGPIPPVCALHVGLGAQM